MARPSMSARAGMVALGILSALFVAFAVVMLIFSFDSYATAEGRVTAGGMLTVCTIEFTDSQGRSFAFDEGHGRGTSCPWRAGEVVTVYYLADDPQGNATTDSPARMRVWSLVLVGLAGGLGFELQRKVRRGEWHKPRRGQHA